MKKNYTLFLLALLGLTKQIVTAQSWGGIYGTYAGSLDPVSPDMGGGIGLSLFGMADTLAHKKSVKPLVAQFGFTGFYSGLGSRYFYNVPLIGPTSGYSKVKLLNEMYAGNFAARFYFSGKKNSTPYVELSGGYFDIKSRLVVTPNSGIEGVDHTKIKQMITSAQGFDYGIRGGFLISMNKRTKFDIGLSYTGFIANGPIANLNSAYSNADGINLNLKDAPQSMVALRAGFVFYIDKSKVTVSPNYIQPNYTPQSNGIFPVVQIQDGGYNTYPDRTGGGGSNGSGNWNTGTNGTWNSGTRSNGGWNTGTNNSGVHSSGGSFNGGSYGGGSHVGVHVGGGGGGHGGSVGHGR
jgi:hypothetical protein